MDQFTSLISQVFGAWNTYFEHMNEYQRMTMELPYTAENQVAMYQKWCECSEIWKGYTSSVKTLTEFTNWNATIPVAYGEVVGFAGQSTPVVYMNAFTGYDEETALCRKGDGGQLFMRVGGLPDGTKIFTSNGNFVMMGNTPQVVEVI